MNDLRPATPRRVVVVDDPADTCEFVRAVLESEGYEVQTATGRAGARFPAPAARWLAHH